MNIVELNPKYSVTSNTVHMRVLRDYDAITLLWRHEASLFRFVNPEAMDNISGNGDPRISPHWI